MSALSFLNLLLSVLHLAALATCAVVYCILLGAILCRLASKTLEWPYPKIEVCTKILGLAAMAAWITTLPGAIFVAAPLSRHFSAFGLVNLELFLISGGALLYIVQRAQERYPARKKLLRGIGEGIGFRMALASLFATAFMIVLQLAPPQFVPGGFSQLPVEQFSTDLLMILVLLTALVFVCMLPVNDEWLNYRFSRGRSTAGARLTDSNLNLLRGRKSS